jgi:hypothetical protein
VHVVADGNGEAPEDLAELIFLAGNEVFLEARELRARSRRREREKCAGKGRHDSAKHHLGEFPSETAA